MWHSSLMAKLVFILISAIHLCGRSALIVRTLSCRVLGWTRAEHNNKNNIKKAKKIEWGISFSGSPRQLHSNLKNSQFCSNFEMLKIVSSFPEKLIFSWQRMKSMLIQTYVGRVCWFRRDSRNCSFLFCRWFYSSLLWTWQWLCPK